MERPEMIQKNIQILIDQDVFLKDQKKSFNFSKFVRAKLKDYMNFKRGLENDKKNERVE